LVNSAGKVTEFEETVGDPLRMVAPEVMNFTNTGALIVMDRSALDALPEFGLDALTLNV